MRAVRVVVRGRVQGVGFRAWVVREASALGISGEVANRGDGSVEVEGVGEGPTLERFVAALRSGPPHARIESIVEEWFERSRFPHGFHITG